MTLPISQATSNQSNAPSITVESIEELTAQEMQAIWGGSGVNTPANRIIDKDD